MIKILIIILIITCICFLIYSQIIKEKYTNSISRPSFLDVENMKLYLDIHTDQQVTISDINNNNITTIQFRKGEYYLESSKDPDKNIIDNLRTFGINLNWSINNINYTSTLKIFGSESNMRMIYFLDDNSNSIQKLVDSGLNTIIPVGFYPTPQSLSNLVTKFKNINIILGIAPLVEDNYNQGKGSLTENFKNIMSQIIQMAKSNNNVIGYYLFDEPTNKFNIQYQILIYNYIRYLDRNCIKRPIFQADTMWIGINGNCKGNINCIKQYKSKFAQDILLTDQYWADRDTLDNYFNIIVNNNFSKCVIPALSAYTSDCTNYSWNIDNEYENNKASITSRGLYFYPNSIAYFAYWPINKPDFKYDSSNCDNIKNQVLNNLNKVSGNCKDCKNICYNNSCVPPSCNNESCGKDGYGGWCGCADETKVCENSVCVLRKGEKCISQICESGYYCINNYCREKPIT
jgi:hypothetical protein